MVSLLRLSRAFVPILALCLPPATPALLATPAPSGPPSGTAQVVAMFDAAVDAGLPFRIWIPDVPTTPSSSSGRQGGQPRTRRAAGPAAGISVERRLPVNLRLSPEVAGAMYAGQLNGEPAVFTRGGDGLHISLPSEDGVSVVAFRAGHDEARRHIYPAGEGKSEEPVIPFTGEVSITPDHREDPLAYQPTFHVYVHDDLREQPVGDLHARLAAWWLADLLNVLPGEPEISMHYYTQVPWITDMDYERADVLDRFAIALRQLSLHVGLPYGKSYKHKFLLLTARPALGKASGLAVEGQSEAIATVQGHVSVLAHEFGHTLGATHKAAAPGRLRTGPWSLMSWFRCDSNMHPLAPFPFSCLRYSPENERAIRSYMRHGPVAERTDLWLERR